MLTHIHHRDQDQALFLWKRKRPHIYTSGISEIFEVTLPIEPMPMEDGAPPPYPCLRGREYTVRT